jgi:hypothetical protein
VVGGKIEQRIAQRIRGLRSGNLLSTRSDSNAYVEHGIALNVQSSIPKTALPLESLFGSLCRTGEA